MSIVLAATNVRHRRVAVVVATLADAVAKAYAGVAKISFDGGAPAHFRKDIAAKASVGA